MLASKMKYCRESDTVPFKSSNYKHTSNYSDNHNTILIEFLKRVSIMFLKFMFQHNYTLSKKSVALTPAN